jgi:hypothetical protein
MKICYIISTCDKYLETRVKNQMNTFLTNIKKEDIFYLTSKKNPKNRQFGWNCMDDKETLTWKYIHFIYNMNIDHYDWYVFIEDDTFVFHNRLERLIENYDSNENYYIGKELNNTNNERCLYMDGGAGFAVSNKLYKLIVEYVKTTGINNSHKHKCFDICIGLWIQEITKNNRIEQINNNNFYLDLHKNDTEIENAITFHKVVEKEHMDLYLHFLQKEVNPTLQLDHINLNSEFLNKTTFVLVTDQGYFNRAKRTITDLRSRGNWKGDIVLITIDFDLNNNFKDYYNIIEKKFNIIDKSILLAKIGTNGFNDTTDKREITKLNQWEKLHVFDDYFKSWQRVVFLDAGLRVLDDIKNILDLDYKNKILAPKDGKLNNYSIFKFQISNDNREVIDTLKNDFGNEIFDSNFMLNCIWIYDTSILNICNKDHLIDAMNKYTCCKTNEMGIMNLMFHFKYKLWEAFPARSYNDKFLFDWCELNQNYHTTWRDYCFLKYPVSISFEDT